jgi:hypothetical protein
MYGGAKYSLGRKAYLDRAGAKAHWFKQFSPRKSIPGDLQPSGLAINLDVDVGVVGLRPVALARVGITVDMIVQRDVEGLIPELVVKLGFGRLAYL